jgi:hypothetical protein
MGDISALTDVEILNLWDNTEDFEERDKILQVLQARELFPSNQTSEWEAQTGAYPLMNDPAFLQKLLAKREFAESLQKTWKPASDPCEMDNFFEVTPVQRFVTNLLSPRSPYMSALLYHGVGVGKTCAAVQIAEAWLDEFPYDRVMVVAPPTIQKGFFRTIFNSSPNNLFIPEEGDLSSYNKAIGCTGDKYLRLSNTLLERNRDIIQKRVTQAIRRRYAMYGYSSFGNYVESLFQEKIREGVSAERKEQLERRIISEHFSGKLLIIDEAHNLRDVPSELGSEDIDMPGGRAAKSDAEEGKKVTKYLRKVLQYSEGLKLILMTATPMYNQYREIVTLLNLLLMNDKKATINESDIFTRDGLPKPNAESILGPIARNYVSFMRGENPLSFPIRLFPEDVPSMDVEDYPEEDPRGNEISDEEKIFINKLPIVPIELSGDCLKASIKFINKLPEGGEGISGVVIGKLSGPGNFMAPESEETEGKSSKKYRMRTDAEALDKIFTKQTVDGEVRYKAIEEVGAGWLEVDELENYAPKYAFIIKRLQKSQGVDFVYTRLVETGAIPLALALEANGYTPAGRTRSLLVDGIQRPDLGRQCALCSRREKKHGEASHDFAPAYYGLITGDSKLSPNNEDTIRKEREEANVNGLKMKVVIGSQIASEGVDFRFVREIHVVDSWWHLNMTEQILGRGIRFQSHCLLPKEKRNVTTYLYASVFPKEYNMESADLYSYRIAFRKAIQGGRVSRILKTYAIDCNLNHDAIVISGQAPVTQIDSQGKERINRVNINDMPFTAVCDWTECAYDCKPKIDVNPVGTDDSTYSEFSARWRENRLKQRIRDLFAEQTSFKADDFWDMIDAPQVAISDLILNIINNRQFQVTHNGIQGYIRYCNGYYIFQPNMYGDQAIPMSLRVARIPMRRDEFTPRFEDALEEVVEEENEEEEKETYEDKLDTLKTLWADMITWCTALVSSSKEASYPKSIKERVKVMSEGNDKMKTKYIMILEMFHWLQKSYHKSTNKNPEAMRFSMLEFFWDNWISLNEQKILLGSKDVHGANSMVNEFKYTVGRKVVTRFLNPVDGELQYYCDNEPCSEAIIDEIKSADDDPLQTFKITERTTGEFYGFMAPKNGSLVFKTHTPHLEGSKKRKSSGAECATVSTIADHFKNIQKLGKILKEADYTDFDLRDDTLYGTRKISQAIRFCTLTELVLRYMDKCRINNKRWFLRPVSANYAGLKGLFRLGKVIKIAEKKTSKRKTPKVKDNNNEE